MLARRSAKLPSTGLSRLVLAVFMLQALTPVGYMPAAADSGWLFQLCPDGLAPGTMALLHPGHASHDYDEDHGDHGDHKPKTQSDRSAAAWPMECSFAALANTDWILPAQVSPVWQQGSPDRRTVNGEFVLVPSSHPLTFHARAPPTTMNS